MGGPIRGCQRESARQASVCAHGRRRGCGRRTAQSGDRDVASAQKASSRAGMTRFFAALVVGAVRSWTHLYTAGLPPRLRDARRREIESDLWEIDTTPRPRPGRPAVDALLSLLLGMPSDFVWRSSTPPMRCPAAVVATFAVGSLVSHLDARRVNADDAAAFTRSFLSSGRSRRLGLLPPPPPPPPCPPRTASGGRPECNGSDTSRPLTSESPLRSEHMRPLLYAVVLTAIIDDGGLAQATPDFSGTWTLDEGSSDAPPSPRPPPAIHAEGPPPPPPPPRQIASEQSPRRQRRSVSRGR